MCKHFYRIIGSEDYFLQGTLFFECDRCDSRIAVDRLAFYLAVMGRPMYGWR